jgi:heme oxygenase
MTNKTLSERLRDATKSLHADVERSGIMPELLRGTLDSASYCRLLRGFYEIYAALETALSRNAAHPCVAPINFPELARTHTLEADLFELHGSKWQTEIGCVPACVRYVARLREIQISDAALLVAHSYVRYLGDLSGGQILQGIIARSQGLELGRGTSFYRFPPPGPSGLATLYRNGLNAIPAPETTIERIVGEAEFAFAQHSLMFKQLSE